MVFGQVAPRPLQWWARWVHAAFFGAVTAFLAYGYRIDALPDQRGSGGWFLLALFALSTLVIVTFAIVDTVRHFRNRKTPS